MSESIKNILLKLREKEARTSVDASTEKELPSAPTPSTSKEPVIFQDLAELALGCRIAPTAPKKKK